MTHMAANPIRRRFLADVKRFGGWEAVFALVADGRSTADVAGQFGISRSFFQRVVRDEGQLENLRAARKVLAARYLEEAVDIADTVPADRDEIQRGKLKVDTRLRLAALLDRDEYGDRPPVTAVQLNFGDLHLDALRQVAREHPTLPAGTPVVEAVDADDPA